MHAQSNFHIAMQVLKIVIIAKSISAISSKTSHLLLKVTGYFCVISIIVYVSCTNNNILALATYFAACTKCC